MFVYREQQQAAVHAVYSLQQAEVYEDLLVSSQADI